jgi:hypothetical protein
VTTSYPRETLSIDQQLALRTAATNLQRQFDGTFAPRPSNGSCTPPTTSSPDAHSC